LQQFSNGHGQFLTKLKNAGFFLGLAGYYRKFVKGYAFIPKPSTQLLEKGEFCWSPEATVAFDQRKKAWTSVPCWHFLISLKLLL